MSGRENTEKQRQEAAQGNECLPWGCSPAGTQAYVSGDRRLAWTGGSALNINGPRNQAIWAYPTGNQEPAKVRTAHQQITLHRQTVTSNHLSLPYG